MKDYLLSFVVGILVGVLYAVSRVKYFFLPGILIVRDQTRQHLHSIGRTAWPSNVLTSVSTTT